MTEEFEEKYKEVIDIINNTHTSLMVEDFVEEMYLKIKHQQKEIERLNQEIRKWAEKEHNLTQALLSKRTNFISKDKIKELKEKVENEQISNPYDFSYMINELLEE